MTIPYDDAGVGTFKLDLPGHGTTGDIDFGASVDDFKAAMEAAFGAGTVQVSGEPRDWEIEFTGALGALDLSQMIVQDGVINTVGAAIDVQELTAGNNGQNTTVLATTKFTELKNVEMFEIRGGGGNDTLIIDNSQGPMHFSEGTHYSGGTGLNRVVLTSDGTTRATGGEHKGGKSTLVFGTDPQDSQLVTYSSSRMHDFVPADEMLFKGTGESDSIEVEQDVYDGATVGLIRASNGPSRLFFDNKVSLVFRAGASDDALTLNVADLPAAVAAVTIDGQSSTAGDQVLINGTGLDDVFDFTPTSMKGGTIALNTGGRDIALDLAGIESLAINAMSQNVTGDTLIVQAPEAGAEPGAFPGTGLVRARSAAGLPRLAVEYVEMEDVIIQALDILALDGTLGDDVVHVTPSQVIFTDIFGHTNATDVAGTDVVWLHLLDGNDHVTVTAPTPLPFQLELLAGSSDPDGDRPVFTGAGGDLVLDLDDLSFTETNGSRMTFNGVERFAVDTSDAALAVLATAHDETLSITPLDSDSGRLAVQGALLTVNYSGLAGKPIALDLAAGQDTLIVEGSSIDDTVTVMNSGATFTDDGRSLTFSGAEAVSVRGLAGNDRLDVDNSAGLLSWPGGLFFDAGTGTDVLRFVGPIAVDEANYAVGTRTLSHSLGTEVQSVNFADLERIIDIAPGPLTVRGTPASNVINGDVGANSGSDLVGELDSLELTMDDRETLEFAAKTSLHINGEAGHDTINMNNVPRPTDLAAVILDGGSGNDMLIGDAGDTQIHGGRGDDLIRGEDGNDMLVADEGADALLGGAGDDVLDAGIGPASLNGGSGDDTATFAGDQTPNTVAITDDAVMVDGIVSTLTDVETMTLDTLGGDDDVSVDAGAAFVPTLNVSTGAGDDNIFILLANPAPATSITVDGGPQSTADSATVQGRTGDDQFTAYGALNTFGDAEVKLIDIEDPVVLEGQRIDSYAATVEKNRFGFHDNDGNYTIARLGGRGAADVFRNIVNGRSADIHTINLMETVPWKTRLAIKVGPKDGTDNETSIGAVTGSGAAAIIAPQSDLIADGIDLIEGVGKLVLDDVHDGAALHLGGRSGRTLRFVADEVGNVDLITGRHVTKVKVASWKDGLIEGSVLDTVMAWRGPFGADIVNTRRTLTSYGVRDVKIHGDAVIGITGDRVRSIQVVDGDATVDVTVTSDAVTLDGRSAVKRFMVRGGNVLGANFDIQEGTLVQRIDVRKSNGTGGNVNGTVNVTAALGDTFIEGDLVTAGWTVGEQMGGFVVRGIARAVAGTAAVRSGGGMGAVRLGAVEHLDFLAGIRSKVDRRASAADDFMTPAMIESIKIRGLEIPKGEPVPRFMQDAFFSASSMGIVRIKNAESGSTGLNVLDSGGSELVSVKHKDTQDPAMNILYDVSGDLDQPFELINIISRT